MAIETKFKEIKGITFSVTPLPGKKAARMQPRLGRLFAPAIAQAATRDVGGALDTFFSRLTPDEYEAITQELLFNALADGVPLYGPGGCFDALFTGRSEIVPQLLRFAISEVNFAGFFDEQLSGMFKAFMSPVPTPTKATKE